MLKGSTINHRGGAKKMQLCVDVSPPARVRLTLTQCKMTFDLDLVKRGLASLVCLVSISLRNFPTPPLLVINDHSLSIPSQIAVDCKSVHC